MVSRLDVPKVCRQIVDDHYKVWEVRLSSSKGQPYFFNTEMHESSWKPPANMTQEEIERLPGAAEYLKGGSGGGGSGTTQIRASHILVKHKDSRRPSSWKEARTTVYVDR